MAERVWSTKRLEQLCKGCGKVQEDRCELRVQ